MLAAPCALRQLDLCTQGPLCGCPASTTLDEKCASRRVASGLCFGVSPDEPCAIPIQAVFTICPWAFQTAKEESTCLGGRFLTITAIVMRTYHSCPLQIVIIVIAVKASLVERSRTDFAVDQVTAVAYKTTLGTVRACKYHWGMYLQSHSLSSLFVQFWEMLPW